MKILVIDDSSIQRRIIIKIIRDAGYNKEILEASDGIVALETVAKEFKDIAVILCDWNMPKLNGGGFLAEMAKSPDHTKIPVIMVTTEGTSRIFDEARRLYKNLAGYVIKPFTPEQLKAAMQSFLL